MIRLPPLWRPVKGGVGPSASPRVFVDFETRGLGFERNETIELGLLPFTYAPADGRDTANLGTPRARTSPDRSSPALTRVDHCACEQPNGPAMTPSGQSPLSWDSGVATRGIDANPSR